MNLQENLPFKSYGAKKPIANELELAVSSFRTLLGPMKRRNCKDKRGYALVQPV